MFWSTLVVSVFASITFITSNNWSYDDTFSKPKLVPQWFFRIRSSSRTIDNEICRIRPHSTTGRRSKLPYQRSYGKPSSSLLDLQSLFMELAVFGVGGIVTSEWVMENRHSRPKSCRHHRHALAWNGYSNNGNNNMHHNTFRLLVTRLPYNLRCSKAETAYI